MTTAKRLTERHLSVDETQALCDAYCTEIRRCPGYTAYLFADESALVRAGYSWFIIAEIRDGLLILA